jgi:hypothetical protein
LTIRAFATVLAYRADVDRSLQGLLAEPRGAMS